MEKARILIVEDEVIIARDIQKTLLKLGYDIATLAVSGEQAIKTAEHENPDLVLMDIVLRGKTNGIETAGQILERFDIPIIYLTSYSDEKYLERAKITEPFGYLLKPFKSGELHITIQTALYKHKMEKELRKAKQAAEVSCRVKTDFLRNMSHELRTPLNAIIGFSEILTTEALGDQKKMSEYIFTNATCLLQLIDDVLDISGLEGNDAKLDFSRVNIGPFIENTLVHAGNKYVNHKISFNLYINQDLAVIGNAKRLAQIMHILLSNAVKFTPEQGSVCVTVRETEGCIEICVEDSGIGIMSDDLERIFESFEQADSSLSRKYGGTGLGLALAKKLAELHGGTIRAESKGMGKGSAFKFVVPVDSAH